MNCKIAILGDFNPAYSTHHALNSSIRDIQESLPESVQFDWVGTDVFNPQTIFETGNYAGLWIAPGSPYKNMENVLQAITYTREHHIPVFGNCGGFQHIIIEFAKNVCGIAGAGHEETDPNAGELVISKLSCSLVEQEEILTITEKESLLYRIIQKEQLKGRYYCSYGLNEQYTPVLQAHGLTVSAISENKQVRAFELKTHPFFLGTLFQPALTSLPNEPNPLIIAFVKHCIGTND